MSEFSIGEAIPREWGSNLVAIRIPGFNLDKFIKENNPVEVRELHENGGIFYLPMVKFKKLDEPIGTSLDDVDPDW